MQLSRMISYLSALFHFVKPFLFVNAIKNIDQ